VSGENYIMRSLMICTAHPILLGRSIEKNEMGGTCGTYGGEETRVQGFDGEPSRTKVTWKTQA
jgi:hypothetical protein